MKRLSKQKENKSKSNLVKRSFQFELETDKLNEKIVD